MSVSSRSLWLAGFGAAGVWSIHFLVVIATGSAQCVGNPAPLGQFSRTWWVLIGLTAAALAVSATTLLVCMRSVRNPGSGPDAERVRFMAVAGVFLNVVFLIGLGFSASALFLLPICS